MKVEEKLKVLLSGSKATVATAESCSGGNIAHLITSVPGASEYFLGSVVAYSPVIKERILNVPAAVIKEKGIVSSEVAALMAEGARTLMGSTFALSITGWADIYGDDHEPAGTAWVGITGPAGTRTYRLKSLRSTPSESAAQEEKLSFRKANISHFSKLGLEKLCDFIVFTQSIDNQ